MADLLGATNPVPGLDNAAANRGAPISPNDRQLQNIPEPTRVSRADGAQSAKGPATPPRRRCCGTIPTSRHFYSGCGSSRTYCRP